MSGLHWVIAVCWLVFVGYWVIAAFGIKRSINARRPRLEVLVRLGLLALIIMVLRFASLRRVFGLIQRHARHSPTLGSLGALLCVLGTVLAIWARYHLGRNWGMPMSQKEQPELVLSGPYERVRHPIYGGLMLAMLGSALGVSVYWLLALVVFTPYFIYSARREERLLCREFPERYPAYRRRTRMFWPFLV